MITQKLRKMWPGSVKASGFGLAAYLLGRFIFFGRPLDEALLTFAGILIAWKREPRTESERAESR